MSLIRYRNQVSGKSLLSLKYFCGFVDVLLNCTRLSSGWGRYVKFCMRNDFGFVSASLFVETRSLSPLQTNRINMYCRILIVINLIRLVLSTRY